MTLLHVRAHWSDEPPAGTPPLQPPPAWAAGYPGPIPLQEVAVGAGGALVPVPSWSGTAPGPVGPRRARAAWFPVVAAADLASSGWSTGPSWAGSPPGPWESASGAPPGTADTGYSVGATGFRVNRFRVWLPTAPGTDFVLGVTAPGGGWSTTVATASGWSAWVTVPATVADGKGIWSLSIDRAPGSSVSAPALLPDPAGGPRNAVGESYVSPYGNEYEGVLGVEVDGVELTGVTVTATGSVTLGDCDASGRRPTTLTVDLTPALPPGWGYDVTWTTTLAPPAPHTSGTVPAAGPALPSTSATVAYLPSTVHPTATVVLLPPGGPPTVTVVAFATGTATGVVVPPCGDPTCHDLAVTASRPALCVDAAGSTGPVTFTAAVTPASPAWAGPFSWTVRDQAGAIVPVPAPSPTGATLTTSFTAPGRYTVTAAIVRPAPCDPLVVSAPLVVDVADCRCPTVSGGLRATRVDGCELVFSAQVVPAPGGGPITYEWDLGDGTTSTAPPPLTHRYAPGTSGTRTVTLTVRGSSGCEHVEQVDVTVDCGTTTCPSFTGGITAAPVAGTACDSTLSVVTTPASAASQVTWSLPGGATATGPTATVSGLTPGQSATATATLPATPGCPAATVSTTVTCPGTSVPPTVPACAILLVLAVVLLLLGGVVTVIGVCTGVPWVIVVGAAIGVVGLVLLLIWALVCAARTPCSLMRTLHCMLFWLVAVVVPVVSVLLLIFSSLPCGIAAAITGVAWGAIYAWLGFIMRRVGCAPTC